MNIRVSPDQTVDQTQTGTELFVSDAFDTQDRLRPFEEFIYGEAVGYHGESRLLSLSDSNQNYNRYERVRGEQIHTSRLITSGYTARADEGPDSDPHENLFFGICLSGGGELHTGHRVERINEGDVYINLSRNYRIAFGAGVYGRVVFPKSLLKGMDVSSRDDFAILRRDDPVTKVLRSAAESVEEGMKSGDAAQAKLVTELMLLVSQRVLETVLTTPDGCGHNHLRDRAIAYIHDHLHRADLSVAEVAQYVNASRATLYRAFESVGGIKEFIVSERVARAKTMLRSGRTDRGYISIVAYETGFTAPGQFSKVFKKRTGMSPTQFVMAG